MSPLLTTLLSQSASMTQNLPDQKQLMRLWLGSQILRIPSDWTTITSGPEGLRSLSHDQLLNIELYGIANKLGFPTNGQALYNYVLQSIGVTAPPAFAADYATLIENVWLKYIGVYPKIVPTGPVGLTL